MILDKAPKICYYIYVKDIRCLHRLLIWLVVNPKRPSYITEVYI